RSRVTSVSREKNLPYPLGRMLALADVDERADDIADHVVQERIRADDEIDLVIVLFHGQRMDRSHWRLGLAFGRAESGEIMLADKQRRRRAHRGDIERQVEPAEVGRAERG